MEAMIQFVVQYGYVLLFFWVMAEQAGILAATGSLVSDTFWYFVGQRKGAVVLNWLCKISLEPDSCVRKTETTFTKLGFRTLLVCKFVPGLNTAAPALAATAGIGLPQFLLADWMGALLWASAFAGLGLAFTHQLDR